MSDKLSHIYDYVESIAHIIIAEKKNLKKRKQTKMI